MKYIQGENIFDKFFQQREALIQQFKNGDITKKEYIEESYAYIQRMEIRPFKIMDSFQKSIYNYQYYNMMAKYCYLKAKETNKYGKHPEKAKEYVDKVNHYYKQKDRATLKAIENLDYFGVEAYYIQVQSPHLKNKLFEIIFEDHREVVLHSTSEWLKDRLVEERIFQEGVRKSLIENYINQKY